MAALKNDADEKISHKQAEKGLKYGYKINLNVLISKLKDSMVLKFIRLSYTKGNHTKHKGLSPVVAILPAPTNFLPSPANF